MLDKAWLRWLNPRLEKTGGVQPSERVSSMKIRVIEENGGVRVWVSGSRQQLIIREEEGGGLSVETLAIELVDDESPVRSTVINIPKVQPPVLSPNDALYEQLSDLRRELAVGQKVPSYVIFQDKSLRQMAEVRPQNLSEFSQIIGVGPSRRDKYGEQFLEVIKSEKPAP